MLVFHGLGISVFPSCIQSASLASVNSYFPTEPGHCIRYKVKDPTWHSLDCEVAMVFQYPTIGDFFTTLTKIKGQGYFCDSAIFGRKSEGRIYYFAGCPVGEQAQYFSRLLIIPADLNDGAAWRKGPTVYSASKVKDMEVGSITYKNCVRIKIDNSRSTNRYFKGRGEVYLSRGIGMIRYEFKRADGGTFTAEIIESSNLAPRRVSGRLTLDGVTPIEDYRVQLVFYGGAGKNAVDTDSQGNFSIEVFGRSVILRYGRKLDQRALDVEESKTYRIEDLSKDVSGLILTMGLPLSKGWFDEQREKESWKERVHRIHRDAWFNIAGKASSEEEFKYAIYQSRSIAVKHPEIYLKADVLFEQLLTSQSNMQDYYLERTQNLEEQKKRYEKIRKRRGKKFRWSNFHIKRHKKVDYKELYDSQDYFPFVDIRLHFLGSALKGIDWQAPPLSMAEFLYFKYKKENKRPYLLVTEGGIAYVSLGKKLVRFDGQEVSEPPRNFVLVFNEDYVWYPLMGRDDTGKSTQLKKLITEYTAEDNIPRLTGDEQKLVALLRENTSLKGDKDHQWCTFFAGKLHIRAWEYYPKIFKDLHKEAARKGGFRRSHGSSLITVRNAYVARLSSRLCPATAQLAALAQKFSNSILDQIVSTTISKYLDYVETAKEPRRGNLQLWFHPELNYLNMDDSFLSKASNCLYSATNTAAIFDLTGVPKLETYVVGIKFLKRSGGHAYTVISKSGQIGTIENIGWAKDFNGLQGDQRNFALDMVITEDGWILMTDREPFDSGKVKTSLKADEVIGLFSHLMELGPRAMIAKSISKSWKVKTIPIDDFIVEKLQNEKLKLYLF